MADLVWADTATSDERVAQAVDLFRDVFGYEPWGVRSAPGCVNIIGEHVDYNGGPCVPIALPHRAYVALSLREDRTIRLTSPQTCEAINVPDLDVIDPKGTPGEVANYWIAYLVGIVWALEQTGCGPLLGFDAALWSCVSLGSGLPSSAALERATAIVLDEVCLLGLVGMIETSNDEGCKVLAGATRVAENQVAGVNTGGLDQTVFLRCREGHALAPDCRDISTRQVSFDLSAAGLELLVIDTRTKYSLADGQYGLRRADCEESTRVLGVGQLMGAEGLGETTAALGNECSVAHTRHVVSEIARARTLIELFDEGPLDGTRLAVTGVLLNDSHDSLRDDYEVSREELDVVVEIIHVAGVHGVCMTGGGSGGSAIAFVDAYVVEGAARIVVAVYAERGWEPLHFIRFLPGAPAGRLD